MEPEGKRKLVVIVTAGPNSDKATIGFTIANATLSAGMEVMVFLASDGVELCRDGAADLAHVRPFSPLEELMEKFRAGGGVLLACGSCVQFRGIKPEQTTPLVQVAGVAALAEWLAAGAATVSL